MRFAPHEGVTIMDKLNLRPWLTPETHKGRILWNLLCLVTAGAAAILVLLMLTKDQRHGDLHWSTPVQHHRIAPRGCGLIA
jgi:hypothetical protein